MEGSKVYLITGASSGIGAAIAKCLSEEDEVKKRLVLVARRIDKLEELAKELKGAEEVHLIKKDLADLDTVNDVIKETIDKFGRLDVLINNAGMAKRNTIEELCLYDAKNVMNLNFLSPVALTQAALPHIRKTKGNIILISSIAASTPYVGTAAYAASKAALTQFGKVLALEEAPNGVRANIVSPGVINTEILERATNLDGKELDDVLSTLQPLQKAGAPIDIARTVAFLASDKSAGFATGSDFVIDGGYTLAPANRSPRK